VQVRARVDDSTGGRRGLQIANAGYNKVIKKQRSIIMIGVAPVMVVG
jgi:hypothetical protein